MTIGRAIERLYGSLDGSPSVEAYHKRHGTGSLGILTICTRLDARKEAASLFYEIRNKVVVEVGAGVGLLALAMAKVAKQVIAIESDPAWSWAFVKELYAEKPANLTWIFGSAESVADWVRGDVAIIYTRSGHTTMEAAAKKMCPRVVWGPRT